MILGIETSCDETGAGVFGRGRILASIVASQEEIHAAYGGVVPELAGRAHAARIGPIARAALDAAGVSARSLGSVAAASRPGLKGSLLVGVSFAAGLGCALGVPVRFVDHLHAHLAAGFVDPRAAFPALGMVVSGGHTGFYEMAGPAEIRTIGRTLDDACGETFDKVGRMLGLPFPGGPAVERTARGGDPRRIRFPRVLLGRDSLDFSFSGLKTAVLYRIRGKGTADAPDICAAFQEAVAEILLEKMRRALRGRPVRCVFFGGGVVRNSFLRRRLDELSAAAGVPFVFPAPDLCMDNGAMVAVLAAHLAAAGIPPDDPRIAVIPTSR